MLPLALGHVCLTVEHGRQELIMTENITTISKHRTPGNSFNRSTDLIHVHLFRLCYCVVLELLNMGVWELMMAEVITSMSKPWIHLKYTHNSKARMSMTKKEEIWLSPMTKSPYTNRKIQKQRDNTKTPPKTSTAQRLSNSSHPTGVINRFTGTQPFH